MAQAITVGRFSLDENNTLTGPAEYMAEQGNAKVDKILRGDDLVFNMTSHLSPDVRTAVLVSLQTDFAGWLGQRQVQNWMGGVRRGTSRI